MAQTFFFYDLETSGLDARADRIMQFAGQRTDLELNPLGDPINLLVKLPDDTLPSPDAIMVTKITPQSTQLDGLSEAEFCKYLSEEIFTEGTIATGYNSIRFDDEFMRHLFWRNFYDPYEWQSRDNRSRWDLLDVIRLTRALRPEGINWPFTPEGKATNRLELLTKLNDISHESAHDALSDVDALINVTRLIRKKQPKLYAYLFSHRDKKSVQKLVNLENPQAFVYAYGRYSSEFEKTTVAFPLAPARNGNILVFDLRNNLDDLLKSPTPQNPDRDSASASDRDFAPDHEPDAIEEALPLRRRFFPAVKELKYNRCPAVAPLGVLEQNDGWKKIGLSADQVKRNLDALLVHPEFAEQLRSDYESTPAFPPAADPESALYDGFLDRPDKIACAAVRRADKNTLADFHPNFQDPRLSELLLHYKARNFPDSLSESERNAWEKYRLARIKSRQNDYTAAIQRLAAAKQDPFLLEELHLWYQSLLPY